MHARAIVYPAFWRMIAGVLVAVSRGSPLVLLGLLVFADTGLRNQLGLIRAFAALCLAPGVAAWLLERFFAMRLWIEGGVLGLEGGGERIEIPCAAIDGVQPWTLPLPAAGVGLRLGSGRWFRSGMQVADPMTLVGALVDGGAPAHLRKAIRHPAMVYAHAKHPASRRWYHPFFKFVVFGLVPTVPLFRLHQWIAYGGTFGEYYDYGLRAYLMGFAVYWATLTIDLVLYAAVLRALTEMVAWWTAWVAPTRALGIRLIVERAHRVLYYGAVPVLLLRLLLS